MYIFISINFVITSALQSCYQLLEVSTIYLIISKQSLALHSSIRQLLLRQCEQKMMEKMWLSAEVDHFITRQINCSVVMLMWE